MWDTLLPGQERKRDCPLPGLRKLIVNNELIRRELMMTKNFKKCLVIVPVLFLLFAGCATTSNETAGPKYSGFLSDYSKLQPDPDASGAERYRNPAIDMKKYNKVLLEKIKVSLKDDTQYKAVDPDALKAMSDYLREAISRELGDAYPLVNQPGPDVLRLRVAITDIAPTDTKMTVVVLLTPYATVADLASGAASKGGAGSAPYLGHAGIEAEGLDSETLQLVFSYVDQRYGKKYDAENPGSYFEAYKEWGYVQQAFDYWAKKFRQRLDEIHGKKAVEKKG